jgi:putative membrane protein
MRGYWNFPGGEQFGHHIGGIGVAGIVLMIILWVAVIAALVIGIRALVIHSRRNKEAPVGTAAVVTPAPYGPGAAGAPLGTSAPSLLAILEERYARGEIDREEFLQRKQDLGLSTTEATPVVAPDATRAPDATNPPAVTS